MFGNHSKLRAWQILRLAPLLGLNTSKTTRLELPGLTLAKLSIKVDHKITTLNSQHI